jgi:hypothetical protein
MSEDARKLEQIDKIISDYIAGNISEIRALTSIAAVVYAKEQK